MHLASWTKRRRSCPIVSTREGARGERALCTDVSRPEGELIHKLPSRSVHVFSDKVPCARLRIYSLISVLHIPDSSKARATFLPFVLSFVLHLNQDACTRRSLTDTCPCTHTNARARARAHTGRSALDTEETEEKRIVKNRGWVSWRAAVK